MLSSWHWKQTSVCGRVNLPQPPANPWMPMTYRDGGVQYDGNFLSLHSFTGDVRAVKDYRGLAVNGKNSSSSASSTSISCSKSQSISAAEVIVPASSALSLASSLRLMAKAELASKYLGDEVRKVDGKLSVSRIKQLKLTEGYFSLKMRSNGSL